MNRTERIIEELKEYLNIVSDGEFANYIGVKQSRLSNWKKRDSIQIDLILEKIPEIRRNWLLTTEGEMLATPDYKTNNEPLQNPSDDVIPQYNIKTNAEMIQIINLYKENAELLKNEVSRLKQENEQLKAELAVYKQTGTNG